MGEQISSIGSVSSQQRLPKRVDNSQVNKGSSFQEIFIRDLESKKEELSSASLEKKDTTSYTGKPWDSSNIAVTFHDKNGERVEIFMSQANANKLQEKFSSSVEKEGSNLQATKEARDYLATMWEDFYNKQWVKKADKDGNGVLSIDEQMNVRSFVNDNTGVYHPASDIFRSNKELQKEFRNSLKEISVDEAFDHFVGVDKNLDLKLSLDEGLEKGVLLTDYDTLISFESHSLQALSGSEMSQQSWEKLELKTADLFTEELKQKIKNVLLEALYFEKESIAKNRVFSLEQALKIA